LLLTVDYKVDVRYITVTIMHKMLCAFSCGRIPATLDLECASRLHQCECIHIAHTKMSMVYNLDSYVTLIFSLLP